MQPIKTIKPFDGVIKRRSNLHKGQNFASEVLPVAKLEYKTGGNYAVMYSSLKMVGVFSVALSLIIGVSSVGSTVSYFSDIENAVANRLQAGILALSLSSTDDIVGRLSALSATPDTPPPEYDEPVGTEQFDITVGEGDGSLPVAYSVITELNPANPPGCDTMSISADFNDFHFDGLFKYFVSPKIEEMGEWHFLVSLPTEGTGLASLAECEGKLVFHAGLGGVTDDLSKTFSDDKTYEIELYNWESVPVVENIVVPEVETPPEVSEEVKKETEEETTEEIVEEIPEDIEEVIEEKPDEPVVEPEIQTETQQNEQTEEVPQEEVEEVFTPPIEEALVPPIETGEETEAPTI